MTTPNSPTAMMLPTEPVFPHPFMPDGGSLGWCAVCGATAKKAIHDRQWAARRDLWGGRLWWPREVPVNDGDRGRWDNGAMTVYERVLLALAGFTGVALTSVLLAQIPATESLAGWIGAGLGAVLFGGVYLGSLWALARWRLRSEGVLIDGSTDG